MKSKKYLAKTVFILLSALLFFGFSADLSNKDKNKSNNNRLSKTNPNDQSVGDAYLLFINKIYMPLNSQGKIADVKVAGALDQGRMDGKNFLFSSGFYMSGVNDQGIMWSNAVASASRTEDYEPGNVSIVDGVQISDDTYAGIFVVNSKDEPFGDTWQAWGEAVKGGAYFYDGDGDGVYNPVDINGNGEWDPDEDAPDLMGDEVVWCVFNDGLEPGFRNFPNVEPQGIEIRQTMWAYATAGDLGNIIFLRYSLLNTGLVSEVHDSVYFGVWADPDLGDAYDDKVGCDTLLNAGFLYNAGSDDIWGVDPPCFLIDFFQGPWEETGNPDDFALNTRGPLLGVDTIWGAQNLSLTSFVHYIQGHPTQGDPDNETQTRYYLRGLNQAGEVIDPCNWEFGEVLGGFDCEATNPYFMYSGDPVSLTGWVHTAPDDQRQMSNTGPFTLEANKPVDIVVAYVVGRSTSAIASVKDAKKIDRAAQFVFQNNFNVPPPPPEPVVLTPTEDNKIELIWDTYEQLNYNSVGVGFDMHFEGFIVTMYNSNSTSALEGGIENAKVIAKYDVENDINFVLEENPINNERTLIYDGGTQLDPEIYSDPDKGKIKLEIIADPFTNGPLIKGKNYFFSITGFALNYDEIEKFDALGTYLIPGTAALGKMANVATIINDDKGNDGIVPGKDINTPYYRGVEATHAEGISDAVVTYSVQEKALTTTHEYEVGFFQDSLSDIHSLYYYVKDTDLDVTVIDSSKNYDSDDITKTIDGVTLDITWVDPGIRINEFTGDDIWFKAQDDSTTGGMYTGADLAEPTTIWGITAYKNSAYASFLNMKRIEIRFGETSKSYRYVKNPIRYQWMGSKGGDPDSGFVEVPFQAWVKTDTEEYQLSTGFLETKFPGDTLGMPDGVWYPGSVIDQRSAGSQEYIIIFNSLYDPAGGDIVYRGETNNGGADIGKGYRLKNGDGVTDSMKVVAASPWFDALYIAGFETNQPRNEFNPTGTFSITPTKPLLGTDKYLYNVQSTVTDATMADNWNKVTVYPNPLFAENLGLTYTGGRYDEPYVTFGNLPNDVTIKIYDLSGVLVRTLSKNDDTSALNWDLQNEDRLRVASGMYIALVTNPEFGEKVLKLAIIMPQKQLLKY